MAELGVNGLDVLLLPLFILCHLEESLFKNDCRVPGRPMCLVHTTSFTLSTHFLAPMPIKQRPVCSSPGTTGQPQALCPLIPSTPARRLLHIQQ